MTRYLERYEHYGNRIAELRLGEWRLRVRRWGPLSRKRGHTFSIWRGLDCIFRWGPR